MHGRKRVNTHCRFHSAVRSCWRLRSRSELGNVLKRRIKVRRSIAYLFLFTRDCFLFECLSACLAIRCLVFLTPNTSTCCFLSVVLLFPKSGLAANPGGFITQVCVCLTACMHSHPTHLSAENHRRLDNYCHKRMEEGLPHRVSKKKERILCFFSLDGTAGRAPVRLPGARSAVQMQIPGPPKRTRLPEEHQRAGPPAAHWSCVAAAVHQPGHSAAHPAEGASRGQQAHTCTHSVFCFFIFFIVLFQQRQFTKSTEK